MKVRIFWLDNTDPDNYTEIEEVVEEGSYTVLVRIDGERDVRLNTSAIRRIYFYKPEE